MRNKLDDLISDTENTTRYNSYTDVSNEDIGYQGTDVVVQQLIEKVTEVVDYIHSNKLNTPEVINNSRTVKGIFKEINSMLSERFGIELRHTLASSGGYFVFPMNMGGETIMDSFRLLSQRMFDGLKGPSENTKNLDDILTTTNDNSDIVKRISESYRTLNKHMRTNKVSFDLENAKVHGLPKSYKVVMGINLYGLIYTYEFKPVNIVAAMLHEVGHAFTWLYYSYRTTKNTTILVEALKDINDGKDRNKTITIAYKDISSKKSKAKTDMGIILEITEAVITSSDDFNIAKTSSTDSESLADRFVSRFGLGDDLVKIDRLISEHNLDDKMDLVNIINKLIMLLFILFIIMLIGTTISIQIAIFYGFWYAISISPIMSIKNNRTYDYDKHRLQRILNDNIRILRSNRYNLSKKEISALLEKIEYMQQIISITDNDFKTKEKVIAILIPFFKNRKDALEIEQLLEKTMENDLHVARYKLKNM